MVGPGQATTIMDEDEAQLVLTVHFQQLVTDGDLLLQELSEISNTVGVAKLQRKIVKEISVLKKRQLDNTLKKEHLNCSNLHFYKAMVQEIKKQHHCEAVLETFLYKSCGEQEKRLTVDILSHKGQRWVKVIARKPLALHQIFVEGDNCGRTCIMDQGKYYVEAASQNLHLFYPPQVVFSFVSGVPEKMKIYLEKLGIVVEGEVITVEDDMSSDSSTSSDSEKDGVILKSNTTVSSSVGKKDLVRLNLCVTTMIAYVSSLTNGSCHCTFVEPLLNQQAEWERVKPVKPFLDNLFKGKELICCPSAVEDFKKIVEIVGGIEEKCRAKAFLNNLMIVPEVSFKDLKPSGKIKERSLRIFGTGLMYKAITVTANKGFVHAAKQKGVKFAVITHESRALSECKEVSCSL